MTQSLYFNWRHSPVATLSLLLVFPVMHVLVFSPCGLQATWHGLAFARTRSRPWCVLSLKLSISLSVLLTEEEPGWEAMCMQCEYLGDENPLRNSGSISANNPLLPGVQILLLQCFNGGVPQTHMPKTPTQSIYLTWL